MRSLAPVLLAALLAAPVAADIVRETDRYERARILPGETISRTLGCRNGDVAGGGYWLTEADDPAAFRVTANFPLLDDRWRVDVMNVSDRNQPLTLRLYVLCLVEEE